MNYESKAMSPTANSALVNPKPMVDYPVAAKQPQLYPDMLPPSGINIPKMTWQHMGFAYLFNSEEELANESQVAEIMCNDAGIVRYSQLMADNHGRDLASVLFKAAQIVIRQRNGLIEKMTFSGQCVISGSRIEQETHMPYEVVQKNLTYMAEQGILTHYAADRSNESIFNDWYTFADEEQFFPPYGKWKY